MVMTETVCLAFVCLFTIVVQVHCAPDKHGSFFFIRKDSVPEAGNVTSVTPEIGSWTQCLAKCVSDPFCGSVYWDELTHECTTLAQYHSELTFTQQAGTIFYSKEPCGEFPLYDRSSWGAVPRQGTPGSLNTPVSYVVVHHTALSRGDSWPSDCGDLPSCFAALQGIQHYDMISRTNTWVDIGVNFFLDGSGRLYEGRGFTYKAAYLSTVSNGGVQTYGGHLAVTIFGDFRSQMPSEQARSTLRAFCACAIEQGHLNREYTVLGHVEDKPFSSYECPGQAMLDMLHSWPII